MKYEIGDTVKIETAEIRGEFEIIGKYKDAYGLNVLRVRGETDRLGGYRYLEIEGVK